MRYGSFWDEGRRWLAQRWAASWIHHLGIVNRRVLQTCGNSLCVQHLVARDGAQGKEERFHWLGVQKGFIEPEAAPEPDPISIPFYLEPDWLKPFLPKMETNHDPF